MDQALRLDWRDPQAHEGLRALAVKSVPCRRCAVEVAGHMTLEMERKCAQNLNPIGYAEHTTIDERFGQKAAPRRGGRKRGASGGDG
jgi:hypothetical protein